MTQDVALGGSGLAPRLPVRDPLWGFRSEVRFGAFGTVGGARGTSELAAEFDSDFRCEMRFGAFGTRAETVSVTSLQDAVVVAQRRRLPLGGVPK